MRDGRVATYITEWQQLLTGKLSPSGPVGIRARARRFPEVRVYFRRTEEESARTTGASSAARLCGLFTARRHCLCTALVDFKAFRIVDIR